MFSVTRRGFDHALFAIRVDGAAETKEGTVKSDIEKLKAMIVQEEGRLVGQEVDGQWRYMSIDENDPEGAALEYSPEFAERIIAASCGEFEEIDVDEMIAMLDVMIAQARSRQTDTQ